ncbi:hypothetical protein HOD96_02580 [Candidatus Falkowbacteria bacterium]|nr:hypothetical protein [Candidatus Falkowbacteria bacterium]MBT4433465.1 hypothetical protein [Candidatus Falkowbacteria bacterium]
MAFPVIDNKIYTIGGVNTYNKQ